MSQKTNKNDKMYATSGNYILILIGSTVAMQWEDGGLWTHGKIVGKGDHNYNDRSYTIQEQQAYEANTENS